MISREMQDVLFIQEFWYLFDTFSHTYNNKPNLQAYESALSLAIILELVRNGKTPSAIDSDSI